MSIQNEGQEMYQRPQYAGGGPEVQRQMDSLRELRMAQEKAAHEASLGAYAAMRHQDRTTGAMLGQALGGGSAQMLRATGKVVDVRALADALCSMLSDFAGEHESSEGAVECLARLLAELRRFRQHIGGDLRKWVHDGPPERGLFSWTPGDVDRLLKDLEATTRAFEAERANRQPSRGEPGKMFTRETICAIIRGQMAITHDSHLRDLLTIFENLE